MPEKAIKSQNCTKRENDSQGWGTTHELGVWHLQLRDLGWVKKGVGFVDVIWGSGLGSMSVDKEMPTQRANWEQEECLAQEPIHGSGAKVLLNFPAWDLTSSLGESILEQCSCGAQSFLLLQVWLAPNEKVTPATKHLTKILDCKQKKERLWDKESCELLSVDFCSAWQERVYSSPPSFLFSLPPIAGLCRSPQSFHCLLTWIGWIFESHKVW